MVSGGNGGRPVIVTAASDGPTVVKVGVDGYGPKQLLSATFSQPDVPDVELTAALMEVFGRAIPVGEQEGRVAGTGSCPQ